MSRRRFVRRSATTLAALAGGTAALGGNRARGAANGVTTFSSPPLAKFVDELPVLNTRSAGGTLVEGAARHRFHRDLGVADTWSYDNQSYLGPILEAHRDDPVRQQVRNRLGRHPFAKDIDPTVHGASDLDRTKPRTSVHLHGGVTEPGSDGHPLASIRPGGARRYRYGNPQEATALWYHDHSMGITRMNVHAGLAGMYLLRDEYDTGTRRNTLGLPSGEQEVSLLIQDKIFESSGQMNFRTSTYVPEGTWEGAQAGDVAVVNGKVWPDMRVGRGLYRFRLLNPSNTRPYLLSFANGMRFWVIGGDGGLLNEPVPTRSVRVAAAERVDLLVDFGGLAPGESVVLRNTQRLSFQFQLFGDPEIDQIMRFTATRARTPVRRVPRRLRGGRRRPPRLETIRELGRPVTVRNMTITQLIPGEQVRFPPAEMNLNNLRFDTGDVERPRAGTVEQWNLVNLFTDDHPIHIHIANFRVLGRQPLDNVRYQALNPRPLLVGERWAPDPDPYVTGPLERPPRWERGWKDTVHTEPRTITRLLVRWPSEAEMGFDPDAPFPIPATLEEGAPGIDRALAPTAVCRLSTQTQPAPNRARGYVWHCHVLDHEDHEMMLPLRIG